MSTFAHTIILYSTKSTGDTVMPVVQLLSLGLSSKLLISIPRVLKLALYLTEKSVKGFQMITRIHNASSNSHYDSFSNGLWTEKPRDYSQTAVMQQDYCVRGEGRLSLGCYLHQQL